MNDWIKEELEQLAPATDVDLAESVFADVRRKRKRKTAAIVGASAAAGLAVVVCVVVVLIGGSAEPTEQVTVASQPTVSPTTGPADPAPEVSESYREVALLTAPLSDMDALGGGRLFFDPNLACVYLRTTDRVVAVWPPGYTATVTPLEVRDATGAVIAREGDVISAGGGFQSLHLIDAADRCGATAVDGAFYMSTHPEVAEPSGSAGPAVDVIALVAPLTRADMRVLAATNAMLSEPARKDAVACLREAGYEVPDPEVFSLDEFERYLLFPSMEQLRTVGFGIIRSALASTTEQMIEAVIAQSPGTAEEFALATDGCMADAPDHLSERFLAAHAPLIAGWFEALDRIEASPEMAAARDTWTSCMATNGYPDMANELDFFAYADSEISALFYSDDPSKAFTRELELAADYADCLVPYVAVRSPLRRSAQTQFLDENQHAVASLEDLTSQVTAEAQRLLDPHLGENLDALRSYLLADDPKGVSAGPVLTIAEFTASPIMTSPSSFQLHDDGTLLFLGIDASGNSITATTVIDREDVERIIVLVAKAGLDQPGTRRYAAENINDGSGYTYEMDLDGVSSSITATNLRLERNRTPEEDALVDLVDLLTQLAKTPSG